MNTLFKRLGTQALLVAVAATAFTTASFAADANAAVADTAQKALVAQMGGAAKDLAVTVDHGVASLSGWALRPADVNKARAIVSTVSGVESAYSSGVHTWTSSDHL